MHIKATVRNLMHFFSKLSPCSVRVLIAGMQFISQADVIAWFEPLNVCWPDSELLLCPPLHSKRL